MRVIAVLLKLPCLECGKPSHLGIFCVCMGNFLVVNSVSHPYANPLTVYVIDFFAAWLKKRVKSRIVCTDCWKIQVELSQTAQTRVSALPLIQVLCDFGRTDTLVCSAKMTFCGNPNSIAFNFLSIPQTPHTSYLIYFQVERYGTSNRRCKPKRRSR
jgi:hypothetical protein